MKEMNSLFIQRGDPRNKKADALRLKGFLYAVTLLFLSGCATVGINKMHPTKPYLVSIDSFCKKHDLKYKYYPFYENIVLRKKGVTVELKPGYRYAKINGKVRDLSRDVVYDRGKVFIPSSLGGLLSSLKEKPSKLFKDLISLKIDRIVIDPGHGGRDPGAISPWGVKEKDVNLVIAKYLADILKKKGFKVYLTRTGDYFISLKQRVQFTKKHKADLFISVHANSYRSRKIKGLEVYYLSSKFSDTQSKILAAAENLCRNEGVSIPSEIKGVVGRMMNTENKRETKVLASSILKSADHMGICTRKSLGAPFYVLKYNSCPAVLVETGYLTNYREERLLRTSLYKKQLALAIAEGVVSLENNVNQRVLAER